MDVGGETIRRVRRRNRFHALGRRVGRRAKREGGLKSDRVRARRFEADARAAERTAARVGVRVHGEHLRERQALLGSDGPRVDVGSRERTRARGGREGRGMRRERARPDRGRVGFRGTAGGPRVRRPEPRTETRAVRFRRRFRDAGGVPPALERNVQLPRARRYRREETFGLGHLDGRVASRRGQQLPSRSRALVHRARRERLPGKMGRPLDAASRLRRGTPCSRALRVPAPSVEMWAPHQKKIVARKTSRPERFSCARVRLGGRPFSPRSRRPRCFGQDHDAR